jgi:hypothetical protein
MSQRLHQTALLQREADRPGAWVVDSTSPCKDERHGAFATRRSRATAEELQQRENLASYSARRGP